MFVALDQHGKQVNPIDTPEEDLRLLSRAGLLFCPECERTVRFASGEQVSAHFKHEHNSDCSYESEPETEEHIKGKVIIRSWLKERYPEAKVEFEYKIKETNQRADVIAIFPGDRKLAFEMQCSKIQGAVWRERHKLYKQAGIKDYWILGDSVHKYGKTAGEEDKEKHQLVSLANYIFQETGSVLFLDTEQFLIKGIYKHLGAKRYSDTIVKAKEITYPITEGLIHKEHIVTEEIKIAIHKWLENYKKEQEKRREEARRYKEEQEIHEREREQRVKEIEDRQKIQEAAFKKYIVSIQEMTLNSVKQKMTKKERELFEHLLQKHNFNDDSFPGIFNVMTAYNYKIPTPHHLWQLWIYDKYIHQKRLKREKIWVPTIKDDMWKLYKQGFFRLKPRSDDAHYSFAIFEYFRKISLLDIVIQLGGQNGKYQKILYDNIPALPLKETNAQIALYLSVTNTTDFYLSRYLYSNVKGFEEIEETVELYKAMIKEYSTKQENMLEKDISTVEYINNLIHSMEHLANDWERGFIADMLKILHKGYTLSDKQQGRITKIKERIEKELNISLNR